MKRSNHEVAERLASQLARFERENPLRGLRDKGAREAFLLQLVDSIHRVEHMRWISTREISPARANPADELFDPLKAAVYEKERGRLDEAFWLVFLAVHFGKHRVGRWETARKICGCLGGSHRWTWQRVSVNPAEFRQWLNVYQKQIPRFFGNHRKYESLNAASGRGTGAVIVSYVNWVHPPRTHVELVEQARARCDGSPRKTFHELYSTMDVVSFGRMAKFDYLSMLGKLGLADIEPGSPYLGGATGPLKGARLLFSGDRDSKLPEDVLEKDLVRLGAVLNVGMQEIEDSLCNWQKCPSQYKRFRG